MRSFYVVMLAALTPTLTTAQQTPPPTQQREHVVKAGDTLWDLARIYLADPFLWPLIYEANKRIVENPHRIFPNERLIIPMLPGERPAPGAGVAQPQQETGLGGGQVGNRTRFYTPADTATYPTMVTADPPALRRVEPREFHATPWLQDTATLQVVGQVFRSGEPRAERDKLPQTFHPFDEVYFTVSAARQPKVGDMLLAVQIGRAMVPYGRVIEPTGVIRVDSLKEGSAIGMVTHEFGSLRTGQLLLPIDSFPSENIYAKPVEVQGGAEGELIDAVLQQPLLSVTDRVFLAIAPNAVQLGDELAVYLPNRQPDSTRPERLPERPIARVLVTRVGPNGATGRIIQLEEAALRPGMKVRIVRKMP